MNSGTEKLTEEEALEVLHEAIREQASGAVGEAEGISPDTLRTIARESGIEDRFIDEALAKRLSRPSVQKLEGLKKGEVAYSIRGELAEDQQSALLEVLGTQAIIARPMPGVVQATVHGRGYLATIQISVSGGRTHIRVTPVSMADGLYGFTIAGIAALIACATSPASLSVPALWATAIVGAVATIVPLWLVPRAMRRIKQELSDLADRVTQRIAEELASTPSDSTPPPENT